VWIVPSEIGKALEGLGSTMTSMQGIPDKVDGPRTRVDMGPSGPDIAGDAALATTHEEVAAAIAAAKEASQTRPAQVPAAEPSGSVGPGSTAVAPSALEGGPAEPPAQ
jgi:hypothetical protein